LVIAGSLGFLIYRKESQKQHLVQEKAELFKTEKPIGKKIGYMLYAYNSSTLSEAAKKDDEQIKVAKKLHTRYIRIFLETDNKYYKREKYNVSFAKIAVQKVRKAGMYPILTFSADRLTDQNPDNQSKKSIRILKNEISQAITAFANERVIWESVNEANSTVFWFHQNQNKSTTVRNWVNVNNFMRDKVRKISPNAIYISGAYATAFKTNPTEMLRTLKMATKYGMSRSVDAVSIHPYNYYALDGGRPETIFMDGTFNKIKNTINPDLKLPLIVSEYGYNSKNSEVGRWQGTFSEADKADNLVRETLLLDAHRVPLMIVYELEGSGFELADSGKLNLTGEKMKKLFDELGEYTFYRSISGENNNDYFYEYRNGGKRKIVYWTSQDTHQVVMFKQRLLVSGTPQYLRLN